MKNQYIYDPIKLIKIQDKVKIILFFIEPAIDCTHDGPGVVCEGCRGMINNDRKKCKTKYTIETDQTRCGSCINNACIHAPGHQAGYNQNC